MAFLSWLMSQGHSLDKIAPPMVASGDSGTLAQLYAKLTSDTASNAWPKFKSAVQALPNGITSDNPFGAVQPAQIASERAAKPPAGAVKASAPASVCPPKSKRLLPPNKTLSRSTHSA
jgi:hypothetical protein